MRTVNQQIDDFFSDYMGEDRPTSDEAQQWANALRSGKYKQGRGRLENPIKTFCCLGVACMVFIPKSERLYDASGELLGSMPHHQSNAPNWLKDIDSTVKSILGYNLTAINDGYKYSFDEIADLIELLFVHKALDPEPDGKA